MIEYSKKEKVFPAGIQRLEEVPLWSYFGRDVPCHNRTKIRPIRFLTYFDSSYLIYTWHQEILINWVNSIVFASWWYAETML